MTKRIKREYFMVHTDASGAPAVYWCDGFMFTFDCLGKVMGWDRNARGPRHLRRRAFALCLWAYRKDLAAATSPEWHAANCALCCEGVEEVR